MIIVVDETEIDLEKLISVEDFDKCIDDLKPVPLTKLRGYAKTNVPTTYEKFDELTEKEAALANLVADLYASCDKIYKKMFPSQMPTIWNLAKMAKLEETVKLPPIPFETFADYQKITQFYWYARYKLDLMKQTRIGFGLYTLINSDGKIHVLSDLRELHKAGM